MLNEPTNPQDLRRVTEENEKALERLRELIRYAKARLAKNAESEAKPSETSTQREAA